MKINFKMFLLILALALIAISQVEAIECTPYVDCRYQGAPLRDPDGKPHRDTKVISAYKKLHICPSTGLYTTSCPGYALNHNCSLACGCVDAVWNLSYIKDEYKTGYAILPKDAKGKSRTSPMGYINENGIFVNMQNYAADRIERKINASNPPQPDTAACVNQIIK